MSARKNCSPELHQLAAQFVDRKVPFPFEKST
jgi:hypothetical protein